MTADEAFEELMALATAASVLAPGAHPSGMLAVRRDQMEGPVQALLDEWLAQRGLWEQVAGHYSSLLWDVLWVTVDPAASSYQRDLRVTAKAIFDKQP